MPFHAFPCFSMLFLNITSGSPREISVKSPEKCGGAAGSWNSDLAASPLRWPGGLAKRKASQMLMENLGKKEENCRNTWEIRLKTCSNFYS